MGLGLACRVVVAAATSSSLALYALQGTAHGSEGPLPGPVLGSPGVVPAMAPLPTRAEQLHRLRTTIEFDVLVLGGGSIACGAALDATARGLSVALIDLEDFGAGASTRCAKLLPATARGYHEPNVRFHLKLFKGNKQAIEERRAIIASAPHLCHCVPVLVPHYSWHKALYMWFYFKTHWHVNRDPPMSGPYWVSNYKTRELFPLLRKDKLVGSVIFHEVTIDDVRMNVALALTAARRGAVVVNHIGAYRFLKDRNGRVKGALVKDTLTGDIWPVRAKSVINATGSGADSVRMLDSVSAKPISWPVISTHLVLPWHFGHKSIAVLAPTEHTMLLAMPHRGQTLVNGLHKRLDSLLDTLPSTEAVTKLLRDWNEQLDSNTVSPRLSEVLSTWTSVSSVQERDSGCEKHIIEVSQSGLVSITGGTWTWYRLLAERAVDAAIASCDDKLSALPCSTKNMRLEGAAHWSPTLYVQLLQKYRLEADVAKHLVEHYGDQAMHLARMAANACKGARSLNPGERLLPRLPYIEAEVRHAVRHEYACTAVDVLARRLGVAFEDAHAAECMLPRVADIMALELDWSSSQRECQLREATRFLEEQMGLALCRPHRHAPVLQLNSNEFARLVRLFEFLDTTQTGWVSLRHLRPYILKEQFIQDSVLTTLLRHLVDIVISTEPRSYIFNECYVPLLYRSSVESGSTKGTEVFTEKVEALSKTSELTRDSLATILDEMEDATSGGMELGDFLLFMNNLKICQRAQRKRRNHKDTTQGILAKLHIQNVDLAELRIQNIDTPFPGPPDANNA